MTHRPAEVDNCPPPVVTQLRPGSDEYEAALAGVVRAERVNYVVADPTSKRYRQYLRHIQNGWVGEPDPDRSDEFRDAEARLAMIGKALRAYRDRDDTTVRGGLIYRMGDLPIAAAPDGVDSGCIALQVHVRQSLETYEKAVERGITQDMARVSQAQMIVSGLRSALHINYFEDAECGIVKLHDKEVVYDRREAGRLMDEMIRFVARTRYRAGSAA